jgi:hypothetical protein
MTSSLSNQPYDNGNTSFCNKSFHLANNHNVSALENKLSELSNSGKPLGNKNFGKIPFQLGKLSTSVSNLGLPLGANNPVTIGETMPNILQQGPALLRPYDRVDNARMQLPYVVNGFGRRKSKKRKSKKRKSKKIKSKKRKSKKRKSKKRTSKKRTSKKKTSKKRTSKKRKFGVTPGTGMWKNSNVSNAPVQNNIQFYEGKILSGQNPNLIGGPNLPGNYTNNQMNNPYFNFGKKTKKNNNQNHKKEPEHPKKPKRHSFGYGPNTVAYNKPFPMYHAGANTVNFSTGKLFNPNILSNSGGVKPDGMTPNAWLTQSVGVGDGLGNKYRFGKNIYTPNNMSSGSGRNVLMQPGPSLGNNSVKGDFMNFGKKLTASFGGSVISLDSAGKVSVSRN